MSIARKFATFRRIAREDGIVGVLASAEWNYGQRIPGYPRAKRAALAALCAPDAIAVRRRYPKPNLVVGYYGGIGDELLLTVVVHEVRRRGYRGTWMMSEYPEVWRHNPDPDVVLEWDRGHARWAELFRWNVIYPWYSRYLPDGDRDVSPPQHILAMMCEQVGVVGPVSLKPHFVLTDDERERGALVPNQILIQSGGMNARFAMKTKQWFPERYQAVVDALRGEFNFVQIGSKTDPPLEGVLDLRGKSSVRETAGIMSRSVAFVGQVGMLMHLARAVDCRSVIVYGGREHPTQTGYSCNENLSGTVACSPCWKLNTCGHDMACMRQVQASDVVAAVERQVARYREPLPVDVAVITAEGVPARTTADGRTLLTITNVFGQSHEVEAKFLPATEAARGAARQPQQPAVAA